MPERTHKFYKPVDGHRLEVDQYDLLKECSQKGDLTKWNQWRENNNDVQIWLCGADFRKFNFRKANLSGANLQGANFYKSDLTGTDLNSAQLQDSYMSSSLLMGVDLDYANLSGVRCRGAACDGETLLWHSKVDRHTDFTGFGLGCARIHPGLRLLLDYNIRKFSWEDWYKRGKSPVKLLKHIFVKPFWFISDYGQSTFRILMFFMLVAALFASAYYFTADANPLIDNLRPHSAKINGLALAIRCMYFSIVTMTTLGFGDMYAQYNNPLGQIVVTCQVLIGYFLLGALVTRLSILFTSGCPSLTFEESGIRHENW